MTGAAVPKGTPVAMHYGFARSEPGHPGILLHADGQPCLGLRSLRRRSLSPLP
jgi:hypothetical protein